MSINNRNLEENKYNSKLEELKILKEELKKEVGYLRKKKYRRYLLPIIYILFGLLLLFIGYIGDSTFFDRSLIFPLGAMFIIFGIFSFIILIFMKDYGIVIKEEHILEIDDEIELLEISENQYEKRAEMQFRKHQKEIKRYYDINLGHLKLLFPIGVGIIISGIVIIISSIILFNEKNTIQIIVGTSSGLLTNFVGTIFIKMYIETMKASLKFHNKLIDSNNNLFANVLITKIKNQNLQDETLAELAKIIPNENSYYKENTDN